MKSFINAVLTLFSGFGAGAAIAPPFGSLVPPAPEVYSSHRNQKCSASYKTIGTAKAMRAARKRRRIRARSPKR